MLKDKQKLTPDSIKRNRRRFKMKRLIAASNERKLILYVFRSNKNIHLNLLQDGSSVINENTILIRRENPKVLRRDLLCKITESFVEKLISKYPDFKLTQLVVDIAHYQYKGNVKLCVDQIRKLFVQKTNSPI